MFNNGCPASSRPPRDIQSEVIPTETTKFVIYVDIQYKLKTAGFIWRILEIKLQVNNCLKSKGPPVSRRGSSELGHPKNHRYLNGVRRVGLACLNKEWKWWLLSASFRASRGLRQTGAGNKYRKSFVGACFDWQEVRGHLPSLFTVTSSGCVFWMSHNSS